MGYIFGDSKPTFEHGFQKSDASGISISEGPISLVQDYNITFQQNATPLYEVGSVKVYFSAAPQTGTMAINLVVDKEQSKLFEPTVCKPGPITVAAENCDGALDTFTCEDAFPTQVTIAGQSQQAHATLSVNYMFVALVK